MHFASEPLPLAVAALTFLLAGFVKGVIGLGLPTVAMGLLSTVVAPAQAASLLILPSFVTNAWQLATGPRFAALARRLWPMMAGIVVGTLAGSGFMQGGHAGQAASGLGVALMIYAVLGLTAVRFSVPPRAEPWLGPVIGTVTGLVTAATGVFVIPAVPYIGALSLRKDDLIQALGLSFTVSTVALAAALAGSGSFEGGTAGASALALAPALIGMFVGGWVRGRVSEKVFRRCFFLGLLALGAHLASRALI
ncbi:sulfite exporter TauE/SafE family protein [Methylobacterium sp. P31]